MRGRSFRISLFIIIILAISISSLGFTYIDLKIPGIPRLERGGNGPLGLKLGLDLRGGTHLVYQADTGTSISFTLAEESSTQDIEELLAELDLPPFELLSDSPIQYVIETSLLESETTLLIEETLQDNISLINLWEVSETPQPTAEQMEGVLDIINRRINLYGTEEPIIQRFGEDRVVVQIPGTGGSITNVEFSESTSAADLEDLLSRRGFKDYSVNSISNRLYRIKTKSLNKDEQTDLEEILSTGIGAINSLEIIGGSEEAKSLIGETAQLEFKERTCTDSTCQTFTDADLGLTGDNLDNAFPSTSPNTGEWTINIQFDGRGSDTFSDLTQRIAGDATKRIAIFLDNEELLAPVARAWIPDGRSEITGNFSREESRKLSIQLESGRLPVPLQLIQESDVDALLGSQSLKASLLAGLLGMSLVIIFIICYYRMAGIVAALALIFYSLLVLAIFKLIPLTLTLPHIGGFILSIGLAVDANILIFERMKEEIRIGRTLASSMEVGFSRARPAIRDGNLSTLITCAVLLWFGNRLGGGLINGFSLSLLVGVLASMFTAVIVSRNLLQLLAWVGLSRNAGFFTPEGFKRSDPAQDIVHTARGR